MQDELKEVSYTVESTGAKLQLDCPQLSKKFAPEEISAQALLQHYRSEGVKKTFLG